MIRTCLMELFQVFNVANVKCKSDASWGRYYDKDKETLFQTWIDGLVSSTLLRVESF